MSKSITMLSVDAVTVDEHGPRSEQFRASACPLCHTMFLVPEVPDHNCFTEKEREQ